MILNVDQIRQILVVKHNCTFADFMSHIKFLRNFYDIENSREEEVLILLKEVEKDNEYRVVSGRGSNGTTKERLIVRNKRPSVWADMTM
jgi:hypothetical protein